MTSSTLACLGLAVDDVDGLDHLIDGMLERSRVVGRPGAVETRLWIDESGAQVTVVRDGEDVVDLVPSFAGRGTATLSDIVSCAGYASASVQQDGETLTRLLVDLPQAPYLPRVPVDTTPALMTALGVDVSVHATPEDFAASEASSLGFEQDGKTVRYATTSLLPFGLFSAEGDDEDAARAARPNAFLSGVVQAAETRTNSLTGERFHAALVESLGFEVTVCLATSDHAEPPAAGAVVAGTCWMVADIPTLWKVQPKPKRGWLRARLARD